jgi:hypothetical protein
MTKQELLERLRQIPTSGDKEVNHSDADDLIIEYIGDPEIRAEYDRIEKWYA